MQTPNKRPPSGGRFVLALLLALSIPHAHAADTYSSNLKVLLPEQGSRIGTWGTDLNNFTLNLLDDGIAGLSNIDLASATSYTLAALSNGTDSESRAMRLRFFGTPASAVTVTVPTSVTSKLYVVTNATGQALTIKYAATAGTTIDNGATQILWFDGTTVVPIEAGYRRTAAEIAAGVTPTNYFYEPGDVRRFGAFGNGSTDDLTAIQNTINAAAQGSLAADGVRTVYIPKGSYRISASLTIPNFVTIVGDGESTKIRPTGNFYAFAFNPGNRTSVTGLNISPVSTQTAGGGFTYTDAGSNIHLDHIYFDSGTYISLNVAPDTTANSYTFRRIRWNGGTNYNTGIIIGGGGALVTDVYFEHTLGTASTTADMGTWLSIPATADTIKFSDCLFIKGTTGYALGLTSQITNIKFSNCTVDSMTGNGINVGAVRELEFFGQEISSSGAASVPGLEIGASSKGTKFIGGVVQGNAGYGVIIRSGAVHTVIAHSTITDNNTSNTASNDGIAVAAGASKFSLIGNIVGNNVLLATGHQKTGISVAVGASDNYHISENHCEGNETSNNVIDNGTGTNKIISNNTPPVRPSTASAATVTLPSYSDLHLITGTTSITSVTASWPGRRVTLIFDDVLTFTDGSNLVLAGNFVTSANDTITLVCDGSSWLEQSRSVN